MKEKFPDIKGEFFIMKEEFSEMKKNLTVQMEENITQKIKNLEKQLVKFPVTVKTRDCLLSYRNTIKLSTFDGKSSWVVYKTKFSMVTNGWNINVKTFHFAVSLREDAANSLQTLTVEERHVYRTLMKALEMFFGEKCSKKFNHLNLKSRIQKK